MQAQEYLQFFQDLAIQLYQITLELPVYAASLTVVVWLLTAIFYSIRISVLKTHLHRATKAGKEIQAALQTSDERTQQLQQDAVQLQAQCEQSEAARLALDERLDDLARQLTQSIRTLADNPELGQQGLTAADGLSTEALWQRFNAAVSQLSASVLAERQHVQSLQQAILDEQGKAEEKNQQLQGLQLRLDTQTQQLAKLTLAAEEHKLQLAAQQQNAQQQLAELEARYRREMTVLAARQPETQAIADPIKPEVVIKPASVAAAAAAVEPIQNRVEVSLPPVTPVVTSPAPQPVATPLQAPAAIPPLTAEPVPTVRVSEPVIPEPKLAEAPVKPTVAVKPKPAPKPAKKATDGKLKGFFASAKETFKKMDQKLGSPTDEVIAEAASDSVPVAAEVEQAITQPSEPVVETAVSTKASQTAKKSSQLGSLFGKLKRK